MSRLVLSVAPGQLRLEAVQRGRVAATGEATWSTPPDLAERIGELAALPELRTTGMTVAVRLHPPLVQLRELVDLPAVPSRALAGLVQHQSTRLFRRNGHPLVLDARWHGSPRRANRTALAAATPAPLVEAILQGARDAKLHVLAIRPAPGRWRELDLLPALEHARRDRRNIRRAAVVAGCGVALVFAAGTTFGARLLRADRDVRDELVRLAPAAAALAGLRQEAGLAWDMLGAVRESEARRGAVLGAALASAAALPDSAWLTGLVVEAPGRGRLAAVAPRSVVVVARLERAGLVAPRLEGEPIPETVEGQRRERFTVRFGSDPS